MTLSLSVSGRLSSPTLHPVNYTLHTPSEWLSYRCPPPPRLSIVQSMAVVSTLSPFNPIQLRLRLRRLGRGVSAYINKSPHAHTSTYADHGSVGRRVESVSMSPSRVSSSIISIIRSYSSLAHRRIRCGEVIDEHKLGWIIQLS